MAIDYTHMWSYEHALYPYVALTQCPRVLVAIDYTHMWSYDHALYPYVALTQCPRDLSTRRWHLVWEYLLLPVPGLLSALDAPGKGDHRRPGSCIIPIYGHMIMHYTHMWPYGPPACSR